MRLSMKSPSCVSNLPFLHSPLCSLHKRQVQTVADRSFDVHYPSQEVTRVVIAISVFAVGVGQSASRLIESERLVLTLS